MSLRVHLQGAAASAGLRPAGVKRFVRSVLRGEGVLHGGVTVVFTDDRGIRALNERFRGRDRATDVLAFPFHDAEDHPEELEAAAGAYLGDVVISLDRARAQAPRYHHRPESELARLLVHGILHLVGYDHHRPADGRRMKTAERRALAGHEPGTLWDPPGPVSA